MYIRVQDNHYLRLELTNWSQDFRVCGRPWFTYHIYKLY